MRRSTPVHGWPAFLVVAMLLLAACGGDEEQTPATPALGASPTAGATASPAAEATPQFGIVFSRSVSFVTDDAIAISGKLFGDGDVAVILSHMFPNDQTAWAPFANELAQKDFSVLTFDFRGYGESGGDKDIEEIPRDLEAALDFMRGEGFTEIYLVGASMGGTVSLIVAAQDQVAGVVAVSAPQSFQGLEAFDVVADVTEPKLFIASEGDLSAASSLELLFEEAPEPKEQRLFTGSAHGTEFLDSENNREFRDLVIEFISGGGSDGYIP